MRMYIMCGNVGTGKSLFAKKIAKLEGGVIVNMDSIVESVHGGDNDRYNSVLRPIYHAAEKALIAEAAKESVPIIVDRTCIDRNARSRYIQAAKRRGYRVIAVDFGPGTEDSLHRRVIEGRGIPRFQWEGTHSYMQGKWEPPVLEEGFDHVISPPADATFTFWAVDFDGTIVYDAFPRIGEKRMPVINWMRTIYRDLCNFIIIESSRTKDYLFEMRKYLIENNIPFDFINENPVKLPFSEKVYADHYVSARNADFTPETLEEQETRTILRGQNDWTDSEFIESMHNYAIARD